MVKIVELPLDYVEACSNCYWGQEEISLSPSYSRRMPSNVMTFASNDRNSKPIIDISNESRGENDFYTQYDIEEYDGPSTLNSSQFLAFTSSSKNSNCCGEKPTYPGSPTSPYPAQLTLCPRNDSLCYSEGPSRWSETGSLAGELIAQTPNNEIKIEGISSQDALPSFSAEAGLYVSESSDEEHSHSTDSRPSEEVEVELDEELEDHPTSMRTANHAQLMLLLMSLSVANPSELTEEEAREYIRNADRIALEKFSEDEETL